MEHSVMEIAKWFFFAVMVMVMFSLGIFFIQMQDINPYKQTVNYTIERSGGLTQDAVKLLDEESQTKYHNKYTVQYLEPVPPSTTGAVMVDGKTYMVKSYSPQMRYGTEVLYRVESRFDIPIFGIGAIKNTFYGTSVSQIRGS